MNSEELENQNGTKTPLHLACKYKNQPSLDKLLNTEGVNINAIDERKQTPLHFASECHNDVKAAEKLLSAPGINANLRDDGGNTPVMIDAANNDRKLLEIFVNDPGVDIDVKNSHGLKLEELLDDLDEEEGDDGDGWGRMECLA